jgi:hypothetical protein
MNNNQELHTITSKCKETWPPEVVPSLMKLKSGTAPGDYVPLYIRLYILYNSRFNKIYCNINLTPSNVKK